MEYAFQRLQGTDDKGVLMCSLLTKTVSWVCFEFYLPAMTQISNQVGVKSGKNIGILGMNRKDQ